MNPRSPAARLPPAGLTGLDASWSRLVTTADAHGVERTWHVLDSRNKKLREPVQGTVLCVHGNPNWSYMWRGLAHRLTNWRVIAVDALNMGFSDRTGAPRRLADHIDDLAAVTTALEVQGPVVTVAHDWGGPISMGWARQHVDQVAGLVLMNTGVARPTAAKVPPLISIARATLRATCELTPTFLHGALRMARPQLPRDVYRGYTAPYGSAERRTGIRDFVEDIPIDDSHASFDTLASVAAGLADLQHVPALLLWGAKDIIFSDMFLHDLMARLPHAAVHRYPDAGHQIVEDTDALDVIHTWLNQAPSLRANLAADSATDPDPDLDPERESGPASSRPRLWAAIAARKGDSTDAVIEMAPDSDTVSRRISFDELDTRIQAFVDRLVAAGVGPGHRVATLVPPGIDLTVLIYACLRAGIIVVAPDAALGLDGLRRALRSSRPDYVVGDWRGLLLARSLRLPAIRLPLDQLQQDHDSAESRPTAPVRAEPALDDTAVIVFTSGSTGPSKGVVYTHRQLEAQRDAVRDAFAIVPTDRIVVAFAPFAVLAPALGITSVMPTIDVRAPSKLTAQPLAAAARAIDATIVFASPAVLASIASTAPELDTDGRAALQHIRSVATAGAPVSPQLLAAVQPVFANAEVFTPYGMTEVMPVTVAAGTEIAASGGRGVCVGRPLPGVAVAIRSIDAPHRELDANTLGEVWVQAAHASAGYDNLWAQQQHAFRSGSWHRSGDVGHLDTSGRLWIEGRVDHLIHTAATTIAPVQIELEAETVVGVELAAAVGIGPAGTQHVAVVVAGAALPKPVVANPALAADVRTAVSVDVAAILVAPRIPVDRRHNSKIGRSQIQRWADAVLRGARPPRL